MFVEIDVLRRLVSYLLGIDYVFFECGVVCVVVCVVVGVFLVFFGLLFKNVVK